MNQNDIFTTETFDAWIGDLADQRARGIIVERIDRMKAGLFGDCKPVGEGVSELRIDHGPGYRVYYVRHGKKVFVLLCGGDKSSQKTDIKAAKAIAASLK